MATQAIIGVVPSLERVAGDGLAVVLRHVPGEAYRILVGVCDSQHRRIGVGGRCYSIDDVRPRACAVGVAGTQGVVVLNARREAAVGVGCFADSRRRDAFPRAILISLQFEAGRARRR